MAEITPTPENIETQINKLQEELRRIDSDAGEDITIRAREILQDLRRLAVEGDSVDVE